MSDLFNNTAYQIMNSQGEYSSGGQRPSFRKKGKVWKKKGDLNAHLNQFNISSSDYPYFYCDIIISERDGDIIKTNHENVFNWMVKIKEEKQKLMKIQFEILQKGLIGWTISDVLVGSTMGMIGITGLVITNKDLTKRIDADLYQGFKLMSVRE